MAARRPIPANCKRMPTRFVVSLGLVSILFSLQSATSRQLYRSISEARPHSRPLRHTEHYYLKDLLDELAGKNEADVDGRRWPAADDDSYQVDQSQLAELPVAYSAGDQAWPADYRPQFGLTAPKGRLYLAESLKARQDSAEGDDNAIYRAKAPFELGSAIPMLPRLSIMQSSRTLDSPVDTTNDNNNNNNHDGGDLFVDADQALEPAAGQRQKVDNLYQWKPEFAEQEEPEEAAIRKESDKSNKAPLYTTLIEEDAKEALAREPGPTKTDDIADKQSPNKRPAQAETSSNTLANTTTHSNNDSSGTERSRSQKQEGSQAKSAHYGKLVLAEPGSATSALQQDASQHWSPGAFLSNLYNGILGLLPSFGTAGAQQAAEESAQSNKTDIPLAKLIKVFKDTAWPAKSSVSGPSAADQKQMEPAAAGSGASKRDDDDKAPSSGVKPRLGAASNADNEPAQEATKERNNSKQSSSQAQDLRDLPEEGSQRDFRSLEASKWEEKESNKRSDFGSFRHHGATSLPRVSLMRSSVPYMSAEDRMLVRSQQQQPDEPRPHQLLGGYYLEPAGHHYRLSSGRPQFGGSDDDDPEVVYGPSARQAPASGGFLRHLAPGDQMISSYRPALSTVYTPHPADAAGERPPSLSLLTAADKTNDIYFLVMVGAFCAMAIAVVLSAGLFAYRVQQNRKSAVEQDYPTYGVVGPNNMNAKCGSGAFLSAGYFGGMGPGSSGSGKPPRGLPPDYHDSGLGSVKSNRSLGGGHSLASSGSNSHSSSSNNNNNNNTSAAGGAGCNTNNGLHLSSSNNNHHHHHHRHHHHNNSNNNNSMSSSNGSASVSSSNNMNVTANNRSVSGFMVDNQNAARMYHFQHQKQQMIISDRASTGRHTSASDLDSEEENEDGSYTVYECPGLASAHDMEIKNPLFNDDQAH